MYVLKLIPGPGRISILPQNTHIREIRLRLSQPFLLLSFSCRLPNHPQNHTVWTARAVCADGLYGAEGLGGKLAWLWLVGWFWLWGSSRLAERALSGMPRPPHPPPSSPSWSVWERGERREGRPPGRVAVVSSAALTPRASAEFSVVDAANRRLPFPKSADTSVSILHVLSGKIVVESTIKHI